MRPIKRCTHCGILQLVENFYPHDGQCKSCTSKVAAYRRDTARQQKRAIELHKELASMQLKPGERLELQPFIDEPLSLLARAVEASLRDLGFRPKIEKFFAVRKLVIKL